MKISKCLFRKSKANLWLLFCAFILVISCVATPAVNQKGSSFPLAKRVIIIGLDGFSVAGFTTANLPHLDQLLAEGVLSLQTRAVMPSVTLPNWTSHLTGSGPEQHGVDGNVWKIDNAVLPGVDVDEDGYYPSIFKVLKDELANMRTAYYYNWASLINPNNQRYLDEVNYQEDDAFHLNYKKAVSFAEKHKEDPTLIFLYSVHTDHAGHQFAWMSPEYIAALEEADLAIGELINDLKKKNLYKETHFFLITDHGGKGKGHGGMTPSEMNVPWAVTGPGIRKGKLEEANNNTNTASVILKLFGIQDQPKAWTGEVPESIFEK